MKKGITFALLIVFLVLIVSINFVSASFGTGSSFGGKITKLKSSKVEDLEKAGFTCDQSGTAIEIKPLGSPIGTPTTYLIPSGTISKTKNPQAVGQLILGKYSGVSLVSCARPTPTGAPEIQVVTLNTITLFGTSKGSGFGGL